MSGGALRPDIPNKLSTSRIVSYIKSQASICHLLQTCLKLEGSRTTWFTDFSQIGFRFQVHLNTAYFGNLLESTNYKTHVKAGNKLTLKAPITTAADDKFCNIFSNLQKK